MQKILLKLPTHSLVLVLMMCAFSSSCTGPPPPKDIIIYGETKLTDQWLEIDLKEPLRVERRVSEIVIWFAEGTNYCAVFKENKIKLPDGSLVFPEGQLIDQDGKVYDLELAGLGDSVVSLGRRDSNRNPNLPIDINFTKVRLKSRSPLECRQIAWRNYNPWDEK
jgi:hypothetical protein